MSLALLFFLVLIGFIVFLCLLGILYEGGAEQLLDFSADRVAERRAAAEARDLESLVEVTNRWRQQEGLPPLSDEELRRQIAERDVGGI